ncbi:hypothetical protein GUJ93_ZPchr0465g6485 [Zizania palustris]|uniref:Uncharacterized protein n=1 Tax=Zizania palustris TaxID=103762 RepID=A0A8J5RN77_ZIZPA|nr:hypothetical protein GUJ93_ZPchr0465g6485 [Zizania palustris]
MTRHLLSAQGLTLSKQKKPKIKKNKKCAAWDRHPIHTFNRTSLEGVTCRGRGRQVKACGAAWHAARVVGRDEDSRAAGTARRGGLRGVHGAATAARRGGLCSGHDEERRVMRRARRDKCRAPRVTGHDEEGHVAGTTQRGGPCSVHGATTAARWAWRGDGCVAWRGR